MALVDRVVDQRGSRNLAQAYLQFLYRETGQELEQGLAIYWGAISDPMAWAAIHLTVITAAIAYARPHLLAIGHQSTDSPQFQATIAYLTTAGPLVKVELTTETGAGVLVEVSQERYRRLSRRKGDKVFVAIKDLQVFPQPPPRLFRLKQFRPPAI